MMMGTANCSLVLFDLGGVLFELHDPGTTFGLAGSHADFHERWLMSPAVREHERGAIDADEFAARIVAEAGLDYDADEFLRRFRSWPHRFYPGALDLIDGLAGRMPVALLSNTNAVHWEQSGIGDLIESRLSSIYLSYRTGNLKPEPAAFQQVIDEFDCAPGDILFLDDNRLNVHAAGELGLGAACVSGIDAVRAALRQHGIDTPVTG